MGNKEVKSTAGTGELVKSASQRSAVAGRQKGAYSHLLSETLADYVSSQMEKPAEDQNDIQEELALMRAAASSAVQTFNLAVEKGDKQAIFVAGQLLKKELQSVAAMARTASSIQSDRSDQMTKTAVASIIGTIIDIVFTALNSEPNGLQIAAKIEREIHSRIDLNVDTGTVSLPSDDLVKLMDGTIPAAPE